MTRPRFSDGKKTEYLKRDGPLLHLARVRASQKLLKSRCRERAKEGKTGEIRSPEVCLCVRRVELGKHCGWINTAAH